VIGTLLKEATERDGSKFFLLDMQQHQLRLCLECRPQVLLHPFVLQGERIERD
jgi:hypothetical protein